MTVIIINGTRHETTKAELSFEDVCSLAGENPGFTPTCVWSVRGKSGGGSLTPGKSTPVVEGIVFTCVVTGSA